MNVLRHIVTDRRPFAAPVLTLGNFDGVHRGHQAILAGVVGEARRLGGVAVAMTFEPHPVAVLRPDRAPPVITSLRDKIKLIAGCDVDVLLLQRFTTAFAQLTPEAFVEEFVVRRLRAAKLVVGHSVSFGHERRGNAALLEVLGRRFGFDVEVIGPVHVDGHLVSSSAIRRAIAEGDMTLATALLGRPHRLSGRVERGHARGAGIGFPTANVRVQHGMYPPDGVYAVLVAAGGTTYEGVANVGCNPTFGAAQRTLEAHLFDFRGDLYRQRCCVSFVERLRDEIRFPSVDALIAQIRRDAEQARAVFARRRATT